jgi:hypothetical protein
MAVLRRRHLLIAVVVLLVVFGLWSYLSWDRAQPKDPRAKLVMERVPMPRIWLG